MEAIVGVWITSVVGAAAFSAAGYVLGHSQKRALPAPVVLPPPAPAATVTAPAEKAQAPEKRASQAKLAAAPPIEPAPETKRVSLTSAGTPTIPAAFPPPMKLLGKPEPVPEEIEAEEEKEERPTVVPDATTQEAVLQSSVVTIPPPQRAPSLGVAMPILDPNTTRAMIQDALAQVEQAAEQTKALEIVKHELERQLETMKAELRNELVARAAAEARAEELSDRLARASEEASSLRHRVNMLDRQAKLLRESLKGGAPPRESRRRDLEEAEEMRAKLRDVVDKLERASLPPPSVGTPASARVTTPPDADQRPFPGAPGVPRSLQPSTDDASVLREEIARLASENRTLRAQTLGSFPPKKQNPRDSVPEIDLNLYQSVIDQLGSVAGVRAAVLADEVGSVILGHGELAENLAAFGAYIRDASTRTERLLPLEGVEEVVIRDRVGVHLSMRVVVPKTALSVVLLTSAQASLAAAKKVVDDRLLRT